MAKKPTKRELESAKKKAMICQAAMDLIQENGMDQLTLSDVAEKTGFSMGSLYNFFRTKEGLLREMYAMQKRNSFDFSEMKHKVTEPYAYIMEFLIAYTKYWTRLGKDICRQYFRLSSENSEEYGPFDTLTEFISLAQEAGTLRRDVSAKNISDTFEMLGLGILFKWSVWDQEFDAIERAKTIFPDIVKTYMC